MNRRRLASPLSLIVLSFLVLGCPGPKFLPKGSSFRAGGQLLVVTGEGEMEIRENGKVGKGRYEIRSGRLTLSVDGGKPSVFRLTDAGLEAEGGSGTVLLSLETRRKRTEAIRKKLAEGTVAVPGGSFVLGSESGDPDELPAHKVSLPSFRIMKTEVTQEAWTAVMGANPSQQKGDPQLPVESVSWEECREFAAELDALEGKPTWRLPTEAEWEYAARAGSAGVWSFGDDEKELPKYAWFAGNSSNRTQPVAKLAPNAWGLYDVHGNVWEWVSDWYGGYAPVEIKDPKGPAEGSLRVRRGGGWGNDAKSCRVGNRDPGGPASKNSDLGFRLVRVD
jgi:formylglycine-generating enzyme required for sulfatase activity